MMVDLGKEGLESIVEDGVKDIIKSSGGSSGTVKKRNWFIEVKAVILEYQQKVKEDFLPVLVKDFSSKTVIKFNGGKMCEEDINKVRTFLEMLEKSNFDRVIEETLEKVEEIKVKTEAAELKEKLDGIKRIVMEGHECIFRKLELHVRSVLCESIYSKTVQRSKIEVMLYNFVDGEVPENVKKLFENGMDSVPSTRLSKKETDNRVEEALLEYLNRLGRRRILGNTVMQARSVQDWIRKAKILNIDEDSKDFVEKLEATYPALMAELELVYKEMEQLDSKEELVKKLEKENCVLVICDKNMGMSLFTLDTMRKADEALMCQLGAKKMDISKKEIIENVMKEIDKFEIELTCDQKEYMGPRYDRSVDMRQIAFPFLKSQHKIHKMTEEAIQMKDLSNLKFRPVVDAKQWLTGGYAGLAMQMMRQACDAVVRSGGSVMRNLKSKDGWRFAVETREYLVEEEFDVMITADIQEAYTNISDIMIKKAIGIVCGYVGFKEWKIDLMKKLVDLVLGQNYAETSGGLFKFKKVLPMGYKLSGDALDIVSLAEEMIILQHLGESIEEISKVTIGELRGYPGEFVDNSVQNELSMSKGVKKYKRYVDDVFSQIAGTREDVLNGILAIGFTYPENLTISMNLNIWNSNFLDVFVWKNLFSGTVSTAMRKNSEVPVGHIRRGSSHPEKYKLQSLLGEMLRGRRMASDEGLIELSDRCIAYEFQSIGYSRREVESAMDAAKKKFNENYSGHFVRINEDGDRRYFSYGGGLVHNKNYMYGEVLLNYIEKIKPYGEPGIVLLPDVKIKSLAFTKRRYLERQEENKKLKS